MVRVVTILHLGDRHGGVSLLGTRVEDSFYRRNFSVLCDVFRCNYFPLSGFDDLSTLLPRPQFPASWQ